MSQSLGFGVSVLFIAVALTVVGRTWVDGKRTSLRIVLILMSSMLAPITAAAVTEANWYVVPLLGLAASIAILAVAELVHRTASARSEEGESQRMHRGFNRARALSDMGFGLFYGLPFALIVYAVAAL